MLVRLLVGLMIVNLTNFTLYLYYFMSLIPNCHRSVKYVGFRGGRITLVANSHQNTCEIETYQKSTNPTLMLATLDIIITMTRIKKIPECSRRYNIFQDIYNIVVWFKLR